MRRATINDLLKRFGADAVCKVWRQNEEPFQSTLGRIGRGPKILKVVVMFDKPHWYIIDGDCCKRPGVAYEII